MKMFLERFRARLRELYATSRMVRSQMVAQRKLLGLGMLCLLVVNALEASLPLIIKEAIDKLVDGDTSVSLWWYGLAYFGITVFQGGLRYGWRITLYVAGLRAEESLRESLFRRIVFLPYQKIVKRETGHLLALSSNDVPAVKESIDMGILFAFDSLIFGGYMLAAMLWLSPALTAITVLPLLLIPVLIAKNEKLLKSRFKEVQQVFGQLTTLATEALRGVRILKAFSREDAIVKRFRVLGDEYVDYSLRFAKTTSLFQPALQLVAGLTILLLVGIGGQWVIAGSLSVGTFVAFERYLGTLLWPSMALGLAVTTYQKAFASSERLTGVLEEVGSVEEELVEHVQRDAPAVLLKNVSFSYEGAETEALRNVSLDVAAGERIAVLGDVGSGKSTLLTLLSGLHTGYEGSIAVNGKEFREFSDPEKQALITVVPQNAFLFGLSVKENLLVAGGLKGNAFSVTELEEASRCADIYDDVQELPLGYETVLGERGITLSGGQRQRLALARALLRGGPLLLLDDAFSAVDFTTEATILERITDKLESKTVFIATHRLTTIKQVDKIIVLSKGEVIEAGTPAELLERENSWYSHFYQEQRLEENVHEYARTH